jgi:general L-amino acid transport system permease protein
MLFGAVAITNRGSEHSRPGAGPAAADGPRSAAVPISLSGAGLRWRGRAGLGLCQPPRCLRRAKAVQEETGVRPVMWWKSLAGAVPAPAIALLLAMGFHLEIPVFRR